MKILYSAKYCPYPEDSYVLQLSTHGDPEFFQPNHVVKLKKIKAAWLTIDTKKVLELNVDFEVCYQIWMELGGKFKWVDVNHIAYEKATEEKRIITKQLNV